MSGASAQAVKADWVARVLGVTVGASGAGPARSLTAAAEAWRTASEAVDQQISDLQAVLRKSDDEDLQEIGEYGLNAITGNHKNRLMAAVIGAERGSEGDRAKLAALAAAFRKHIETDERVEACDENPFGVEVGIRAMLLPALRQLEECAAR